MVRVLFITVALLKVTFYSLLCGEEISPSSNDAAARVAVLGYHEFSAHSSATKMCIPIRKFRAQLEEIKRRKLNVIALEDFIAWKKGEEELPDRSVLITIDDGWKSVFTEAFPLLKEFNFPFTIYLYKNYVDGGGRALTTSMIQKMIASGLCSIGSHSVSHPFPSKFKAEKSKGNEPFIAFLENEFSASKSFLEDRFGQSISTYAYPGGYHSEEMYPIAAKFGYDHLFTVIPGKVKLDSPDFMLPRYIILGTHDYIFKNAINFEPPSSPSPQLPTLSITTAHPVSPAPAEMVKTRTPTIEVDLGDVTNLEPDSIVLRVAGFGKVPFTFDKSNQIVRWKCNRPLHVSSIETYIAWKVRGETKFDPPIEWTFRIDKTAAYQPKERFLHEPNIN